MVSYHDLPDILLDIVIEVEKWSLGKWNSVLPNRPKEYHAELIRMRKLGEAKREELTPKLIANINQNGCLQLKGLKVYEVEELFALWCQPDLRLGAVISQLPPYVRQHWNYLH